MNGQSATTPDSRMVTSTEHSLPEGWKTSSHGYGPNHMVTVMGRTPHNVENTSEEDGYRIVIRVHWEDTPDYDELEGYRKKNDETAGDPQPDTARSLQSKEYATVAAKLMEQKEEDGEAEKKLEILTSLLEKVFSPRNNPLIPVPGRSGDEEEQVVTPLHTGHVAGGLAWEPISEILESADGGKDDTCCLMDLDLAGLVEEMGKKDLTNTARIAIATALCRAMVSSVAMTGDVHIAVRLRGHIDTLLTEADPETDGWPGKIIQLMDAALCRIGRFVKSPEGIRMRAGTVTSQCVEIGQMRMAALAQTAETGVVMYGTVNNTAKEDVGVMMVDRGLDEVSAALAGVRRRTGSLPTQERSAVDAATSMGQMSNTVHPNASSGLKENGGEVAPIRRSASLPPHGGVRAAEEAGGLRSVPTRLVRLVDGKVVVSRGWEKYAAVSYCWNQWEDVKLWKAITHTLHGSNIEYCWVDRWCIDQDNRRDKEKEIPRMGDYYMGAAVTIAMLPDVAIPKVLQRWALRDIQYRPVETAMELRRMVEKSMWYTRAWTLQEALLSKNLAVRTSDCTVNLQTLEVIAGFGSKAVEVPLMVATASQHRDMTISLEWGATPPTCRDDERSMRMYNDDDFMGGRGILTPLEVARRLKKREATQQHDMVYAVMGLVDAAQLEVDYTLSYFKLTEEALLQWGLTDWALRSGSLDESPSGASCWAPKHWYEVEHDDMVRCERLLPYLPDKTDNGLMVKGALVRLTADDDEGIMAETTKGEKMSLTVGAGQVGEGTALLAPTTEKDVHLLIYGHYGGEGLWHWESSSLAYIEDRPKQLRENGLVLAPSFLQEWCVGRTIQQMASSELASSEAGPGDESTGVFAREDQA